MTQQQESNLKDIKTARSAKTKRVTKKSRIIEAFEAGERDVLKLAREVETTPSYVAQVLQSQEGGAELPAYFDLYTSTSRAMNVYAPKFRGKMRFKDEPSARRSVDVINRAYEAFEEERDRAGQHHAMALALTMMNRAWTSGKIDEAAHFARWFERTIRPLTRRDASTPQRSERAERPANSDRERDEPPQDTGSYEA